ncbi:hypothetical protein MSAN_00183200 [Mycena sanguinolenta]|uniref:Microtubule associated protein n=1 Tax=Mycena sanguinolenta TaxID=230812 RepID=A0A8H7DJE5_9AGAR|nr:hypothetical protein MSAN_00183200 [Mycena sanguinolenta]
MSLGSGSPLTLTTLLNSLHTHLHSQTQLLPQLHAQLGLPPSALEDELKNLQQQLMRSVEAQIDLRRREVDDWMEKCEAIEAECVHYTKALGGNIKATGNSLGELRKEKVLPVRYEMVTEYQEKLRQLYHTKLEQLTTLRNRLSALLRTLGPDFSSQDIVDEREYQDVTPEHFSKLEKELVRGKGEVAKRLTHLSDTFIQIDWLYTELGIAPPISDDSCSPSTSMRSIEDPFLTPSATEAAHYRILADFIEQAATLPEDTPPALGSRADARAHNMGDGPTAKEWAHSWGSAREEIEKLWDELMVGEEERRQWVPFFDDEHTEELLTIHEDEIKRLKDEKRMKAPLLAAIKRYFDICEEEKELAAAASDQSRLLGRGSRDPGRLLREEKMRKRVSKEKPRLEQDLLASVPAWEQEAGRPFLVHGQSILHILMQTMSAADQENAGSNANGKRKPSPSGRATSVPARATTPTPLGSYAPRSGVVTPAVRPPPGNSNSQPTKRARTDTVTPSYTFSKPAPLGAHRGGNGVAHNSSPSKIPLSRTTPTGIPGRAQTRAPAPPFGITKPVGGTLAQYQALGHGRGPTTGYAGVRSASVSISTASISSAGSYGATGRYASASGGNGVAAKASRARRESFKPRPSVDADLGAAQPAGGRWGFEGAMVKEEENED